ncbi:MAG: DUF3307 domain-containing protein [Imperialibacter sp.]|uniref:DUF3307 domain-containing protein n=1 Tax=Imperialibacter sp. TaxID=2038411 RepID=UPI0032ED1312
MALFLKFLLAHFIGDFCFQPDSWVKDKEQRKLKSTKLYIHLVIHLAALLVVLGLNAHYWPGILTIVLTHFTIDVFKIYAQNNHNKQVLFFTDQALHIAILIAVTHFYQPFDMNLSSLMNEKVLILLTSLVFVTYVSAVLIKVIISKWAPVTENDNHSSLEKAGRFIGILERLFVFGFIVTNHWEAIGFLLAAKSVFRFGDLKDAHDRKLTEYILIGTLLSFGLAIVAGLAYSYLT